MKKIILNWTLSLFALLSIAWAINVTNVSHAYNWESSLQDCLDKVSLEFELAVEEQKEILNLDLAKCLELTGSDLISECQNQAQLKYNNEMRYLKSLLGQQTRACFKMRY
jgi:hypothetical protein